MAESTRPTTLTGLRVVVVGLGPMGRGIARVFAAAGADTTVTDYDAQSTTAGADQLRAEAAADGVPVTVRAVPELPTAVADADLVLEAIVEDAGAKHGLLKRLAEVAGPRLIVASNTSSLSIGELGQAFGDPARVVGMHFFNPPTRMRLVEVVRGPATDEQTLRRVEQWSRDLGKTPVRCADSPNFVVNRVCRPLYYEAQLLTTQQVEPAVVDAVARAALGHRMGPLELLDFVGLHTHVASSLTALREFGDPRYRPIPVARALVRAGLTGRAAGRGFYDYAQEPPKAARARVVRTSSPAATDLGRLRLAGPDAAGLRDVPAVARVTDATAPLVLYHAPATAGPAGAGWLRLHVGGGTPFAEVVDDPVAGVAPGASVSAVLAALGAEWVPVPALPGLVADRLAHCMINEAVLVVEEGTASAEAVDTALRLGMNHPVGPLALLERVGAVRVHESLRGMQALTGDPRYRPTGLLRRMAVGVGAGGRSEGGAV
jgi:3-hydroxybutyryl-CoA dehydrogenase